MAMTLKAARVNKNLTQKEAARIIGVTPETISKWEKGKTAPNLDKIPTILNAYDVKFDDVNFFVE